MTQADAEDGLGAGGQHAPQLVDRRPALSRISGPVADEQTVVVVGSQLVIPRHHVDPGAARQQTAQLVELEAAIDGADARTAAAVVRLHRLRESMATHKKESHLCSLVMAI